MGSARFWIIFFIQLLSAIALHAFAPFEALPCMCSRTIHPMCPFSDICRHKCCPNTEGGLLH
jgi:hypothetical protein